MKKIKRTLCFIMAITLATVIMPINAEAATKVKLNKKKVTLTITDKKKNPTATVKLKGTSAKKAKWTTSNKKVATVKKGKITAKKAGKATITCKVKGKKYTCKVTVVDKRVISGNTGTLNIEIIEKASDTDNGPAFPCKASSLKNIISDDDLIRAGGTTPYGINKIKVTYDGKDVTKDAEYKIDEPQVAKVTAPGTIELTNTGMRFKLTVSYKGVEKVYTMSKTTVMDTYIVCYCGALFQGNKAYMEEGRKNEGTWPYKTHVKENHCSGYWIVEFVRQLDIRIVN